jgi:hypothetical protein
MRSLAPLLAFATACNQMLDAPRVHRGACDPDAEFVQVAPVGGLESELGEQSAQLSHDELTVVFSRQILTGPVPRYGDLYIAHRDHRRDDFRDVTALDEVNTEFDEFSASLSDDLLTLYFDREDQGRQYEILAARRSSPGEAFGAPTPVPLGDENSSDSDFEPLITPTTLYFASTRSGGYAKLFMAAGRGTTFAAPRQMVSLETLTSPTAYENPIVASDGLTIYFSAPADNMITRDIWSASRSDPDEPFGPPHAVASINTTNHESPAWISEDSCRLYFTTKRNGRDFELWMASRRVP